MDNAAAIPHGSLLRNYFMTTVFQNDKSLDICDRSMASSLSTLGRVGVRDYAIHWKLDVPARSSHSDSNCVASSCCCWGQACHTLAAAAPGVPRNCPWCPMHPPNTNVIRFWVLPALTKSPRGDGV